MLDCFTAMIVGLGQKTLKIGIRGQIIQGENAMIAAVLNGIGPAEATDLEGYTDGTIDEEGDEGDTDDEYD